MPAKNAHKQAAAENRKALAYLAERVDDFPQWVVTVAFYTALQVVETVFAHDGVCTDDHRQRNRQLKTTNRYKQIWKHYRPLFNDSLIARYLKSDESPTEYHLFSQYMSPSKVMDQHVNHHLVQVLESARRLMGEPDFLK